MRLLAAGLTAGPFAWLALAAGLVLSALPAAVQAQNCVESLYIWRANLCVNENETVVGMIPATDVHGNLVTVDITWETQPYGLDGALFSVDAGSGKLSFKTPPDFENPGDTGGDAANDNVYTLVIVFNQGTASTHIPVTVTVVDVTERPKRPTPPTVSPHPGSGTDALLVTWSAPDNGGRPAIAEYQMRWRVAGAGKWRSADKRNGFRYDTTVQSIVALNPGTTYQVQVRAINDEGESRWSKAGEGTTDTGEGAAPRNKYHLFVYENETFVGSFYPISPNGEPFPEGLTWKTQPGGFDGALFSFDTSSGELRFKAPPDFENPADTYATFGGSVEPANNNHYMLSIRLEGTSTGSFGVRVTVLDVNERPKRPAPPTVSPEAGSPTDTLTVTWSAPDNAGRPAIAEYQMRWRVDGTDKWRNANRRDGIAPGATRQTITGLNPGATYEVQVRAINDEGESNWSNVGARAQRTPRRGAARSSIWEPSATPRSRGAGAGAPIACRRPTPVSATTIPAITASS